MNNSCLQRVTVYGSGGLLVSGNRNLLSAISLSQDTQQINGIVLETCSEVIVDMPHLLSLATTTGDGVRITNSSLISIRNATFEGAGGPVKQGRSCIRIENSQNVLIDNCAMGSIAPAVTLWITGNSENIRIEGGAINVHDSVGIQVDAGGRSVRGRAIAFSQASGSAMGPGGTFLKIDPSVPDVRIEVFTSTDARVEFAQTVGPADFRGTIVLLQRWTDVSVTGTQTITDIVQGNDADGPSFAPVSKGRRVMLFLSGGAVTIASGSSSNIVLSGGVDWTPPGPAMIEVVFDGTVWRELVRSG
jgi:hypothetical protein